MLAGVCVKCDMSDTPMSRVERHLLLTMVHANVVVIEVIGRLSLCYVCQLFKRSVYRLHARTSCYS